MTDDAGFLRAICEDPFDDAVRLIYADWLADHERHREEAVLRQEVLLNWKLEFRLSQEIMSSYKQLNDFRVLQFENLWSRGVQSGWFRRGYLDGVRCNFRSWLLNGPALCKIYPLTEVVCSHVGMWGRWIVRHTGPRPDFSESWHVDYSTLQDDLATEFRLPETPGIIEPMFHFMECLRYETTMKYYRLPQEADRDFNVAALNYARRMAGLPRLSVKQPLPA